MKKFLSLGVCLFSLMIISSCSNLLATGISKETDTNSETKNAALKPEDPLTFGIIYPVNHPFFKNVTDSATKKAAEMGIELLIQAPYAPNVDEQINILKNMIKKKVDGIAIGPNNPAALTPFINEAIEQGINVICFDTDAPESKRLSFIGTDNILAGKHMGRVVAKLLDYEGKIIISSGMSTMANLNNRIKGVKQVIGKHPKLEIVDIRYSEGVPAKTLTNIEGMIKEYPDFDVMVGIDSLTGPAVVTAWKAQGIDKDVVTFDNLPDIINGIKNKQITSTISQRQSIWGDLIVTALHDVHYGRSLSPTYYTKTTEFNFDNIHENTD
ncbi:ribose transport system substrate-binding protein [Thalassobacillus cyri]|uniref:Ribose transport system substrate-binding protein n=1 Tax=Thalassobacillus cyri TaxID=571932 RepID=A0A1H4AAZ2_9BACI|nr:substrate-binding domain-containing protein [Thalassobacillus cyri]SEA32861.1 ribose transport system substrate-binding protein [Thalassobacillus cyri]